MAPHTDRHGAAEAAAKARDASAEAARLGRRSARLRLRAAWMYYVEEMTQNAIAEALGVGRVTVVRLLNDARALHEVKITLSREIAELPRLEFALQKAFGLAEAVVVPLSGKGADPTATIGAATGAYVSSLVRPGMKIGLGWGRTLLQSLAFVDEKPVPGLSVVSLLGGITKAKQFNPTEFAWQFSRLFHAECYLVTAPVLVDTVETKQTLVEHCGLGDIFEMARSLDAVVVSAGSVGPEGTCFRFGFVDDEDRRSLIAAGAVGDLLYQFYDIEGKLVDHPINSRVMAVPTETLRATPQKVLTAGGKDKTEAIIGALRLLRPSVLITDEASAAAVLAYAGGPSAER